VAAAREATEPAAPEVRRNEKGEPLITNVFADTDMRQALSDVAAQAGVVIIPDSTVQGTLTADLKDAPLEQALSMLLQAGGFTFVKLDGYYLVGAPDPTNPNFYLLCKTEVVELKYTPPQAVLSVLSGVYGRYLSAEGVAPQPPERERERAAYQPPAATAAPQVPQRYRLVITAPAHMIDRIKADIAMLDKPRTQVMLEAVILEVSQEALKNVGIDWATRHVTLTTSALANQAGNLVYSEVSKTEMASLAALVQKGQARLRANPRVATAEGQTAEIEVGKESYFAIVTGPVTFPYTTLEQIKSGILLRITPWVIEPEGEVIARIQPEVRDVTGRGPNDLPEITFRRADTNLRVKNGQSIVIGGLINEFTSRKASKVPLLGDLPLLGYLFRRISSQQIKTEVVIIITPYILDETGRYAGQNGAKQ
jgi:type IV pilus assembly protein PilQ